jgi:hypothetical protein
VYKSASCIRVLSGGRKPSERERIVKRREFLTGSVGAACALAVGKGQDVAMMAKLDRVGVMSGCFGRLMAEAWDRSQPVEPKELDIMDFPQMLAERYHIHNMEVQQIHFLSMDMSYYEKFHERLKQAKSRMVDMPLELDEHGYRGVISPCSGDPQIRARAIELTKQWIDRAAIIECPSVMVNQGAFPENLQLAIDALKLLKDYGQSKNVAIILEPRGRSTPEILLKVIKEAGIGSNPDIGNFHNEEETERGLRMLYPYAKTVSHVKWNPERFAFAKAIQISKEMGFKGVYSLESGGPEPYARVQTLLDELIKNL